MSEENRAIARRLFEEAWNKGNLSVQDEIIAESCIMHDPPNPREVPGPEGEKRMFKVYRTAFPDLHFYLQDVFGEGDRVAVRWTAQGTHKGELRGLAPTGKQVTTTGMDIFQFSGGKIVEAWVEWDALGLMQRLGVAPALGRAAAT